MPGRIDGGRARVQTAVTRPLTALDRLDDADVRWLRAESTLWRRTLDGVVVLPFEGPAPLVLRGPAARIWELLAEPMTLPGLMDAIVAGYAVDGDEVEGDVSDAVATLVDAGALCRL